MQKYAVYTIQQHDTLEALARRFLGDTSRWPDLVAVNRLRWPFLSDDPADQLGPVLLDSTLAQPFSAGLVLRVRDFAVNAFAATNWVLLQGAGGTAGAAFYDTAIVAGWGQLSQGVMVWSSEMLALLPAGTLALLPQGNILYLTGEPQHTYAAGTRLTIYADPSRLRTRVLGTGMALRVPITDDNSNILSITPDTYTNLFGTDLALDSSGNLHLLDRDVQTVSGLDNLRQALQIRGTTDLGALVQHPTFGNDLLRYVGSTEPYLQTIAYAALSQCFLADPRINRIAGLTITQSGDTLRASVALEVKDRSGLLLLSDLIISL